MCSGFEAGPYLKLKAFVYQSTLGLNVIKDKKVREWSTEGYSLITPKVAVGISRLGFRKEWLHHARVLEGLNSLKSLSGHAFDF
jgi:hypothetical protein